MNLERIIALTRQQTIDQRWPNLLNTSVPAILGFQLFRFQIEAIWMNERSLIDSIEAFEFRIF